MAEQKQMNILEGLGTCGHSTVTNPTGNETPVILTGTPF